MKSFHSLVIFLLSLSIGLHAQTTEGGSATHPTNLLDGSVKTTEKLRAGVMYARYVRADKTPMVVHVVSIDLNSIAARFRVRPLDPSLSSEDQKQGAIYRLQPGTKILADNHADLLINANFFWQLDKVDTPYASGDRATATGAVLSRKKMIARARPLLSDLHSDVAMVCFRGSDVAIVDGQQCPSQYTEGAACAPRLLSDGIEQFPFWGDNVLGTGKPNQQVAFGLSKDRRHVWLVTVDGREEGKSMGATFQEVARMLRQLGASDALAFDGGGSVTLVARDSAGKPRLLNTPIDANEPGRERPLGNAILVDFPSSSPAK
jgi:Phosphodiester glycosidase